MAARNAVDVEVNGRRTLRLGQGRDDPSTPRQLVRQEMSSWVCIRRALAERLTLSMAHEGT